MKKIDFIQRDFDIDSIEEYFEDVEMVSTETTVLSGEMYLRNKFVKFIVTGACALSFSSNSSALESQVPFTNSIDNVLGSETYLELNDADSYIEEILNVVDKRNYGKYDLVLMILSFKCLEENWDGFSAVPLEVQSASNAIKLMDLIDDDIFCRVSDIFPNPNGTISMLWENELNEVISLEIGNKTMSYYFKSSSSSPQFFNNVFINSKEAKVLARFISSI